MTRKIMRHTAIAIIYLLASLSIYRPISGDKFYYGQVDNLLFFYTFEWERYALLAAPDKFFEGISFFPFSHSMFFTHLLIGALPIYAPMATMWGPGLAMSSLILLAPVFNGLSIYFATQVLLKKWWPAALVGYLFAFSPIQMNFSQFTNMSVLWWFALAIGFWFSALDKPTWWKLPTVALCVYVQFATTIYVGIFAICTLIVLLCGGLAFKRLPWQSLRQLVISFLVATLLALPFIPLLWGYIGFFLEYGETRSLEEVKSLSAHLPKYLPWANYNQVWHLMAADRGILEFLRQHAFPGSIPLALSILGFGFGLSNRQLRPVTLSLGVLLIVFFWLSLGPALRWDGRTMNLPMLYTAFHSYIPGFSALRNATFFAVGMMFPLSILCGIAIHGVVSRLKLLNGIRSVSYMFFAGILVLELAHAPVVSAPLPDSPELRTALAKLPAVPTVFIPMGNDFHNPEDNMRRVWWSMQSSKAPIMNGYSGYQPRGYLYLENLIDDAEAGRLNRIVSALQSLGVRTFVFDLKYVTNDFVAIWQDSLEAVGGDMRQVSTKRFQVVHIEATTPSAFNSWTDIDVDLLVRVAEQGASLTVPALVRNKTDRVWKPPTGPANRRGLLEWRNEYEEIVQTTKIVFQPPPIIIANGTAQFLTPLQVDVPQRHGSYRLSLIVDEIELGTMGVTISDEEWPPNIPERSVDLLVVSPRVCLISGESAGIQVKAINRGWASWDGQYRLGYRWAQTDTQFMAEDLNSLEGRLFILFPAEDSDWTEVRSGTGFMFEGSLLSPTTPGIYDVVVGIVMEGVEWFGEDKVSIKVLARSASPTDCENWVLSSE